MKILEVTSWEDICKILDRDPNLLPDTSAYDEEDKEAAIAEFKIWMASKAAWKSEGKAIDWNDWDQEKHYAWFDLSGSGFSYSASAATTTTRMSVPALFFHQEKSASTYAKRYL